MIRLNIIVEGPTEETFVRDLLAPHLGQHQVFASARSAETGRRKGHIFRGGVVRYQKVRKDIEGWLKQDAGALVSTMFDYYALPQDFPSPAAPRGSLPIHEWVAQLEQSLSADINNSRFIPYIQLHEFEALLFSDVEKTGSALGATAQQVEQLRFIRSAFETPEHINDSPETAPSKRLLQLFPGYDKPAFGSLALGRIGLTAIRQTCPHFAEWLSRLEALSH
ncbi:DUF4276 family protein [Hyalangium versicolor]|uniref:DUF4276 family protein n=1 Tax=Hyalangium versicolor TaxID=2861190 RepID=UPI001CC9A0DD|nr:DUF4276 family protein [Hyalangium versicolor]